MTKTLSLDELRKMTSADLQKEVRAHRQTVAKLDLAVKMGKEKGSHLLRRERKLLAQMLTVLTELQGGTASSTVSLPKR
jgi:ribosomal protein L29